MCVGPLKPPPMPTPPPPPKPMAPAPMVKAAAKGPEYLEPEKIKDETDPNEKIETRKKKALEIQKVKEGVKEFSSIDAKSMPQSPQGGVTLPD